MKRSEFLLSTKNNVQGTLPVATGYTVRLRSGTEIKGEKFSGNTKHVKMKTSSLGNGLSRR